MNSPIESMLNQWSDFTTSTYDVERFSKEDDSYDDLLDLFESIAENANGSIYDGGYSGRGMYGKRCWGIRGELLDIVAIAAQHGLTEAKYDNLGRESIVYWPRIAYNDPSDSEE